MAIEPNKERRLGLAGLKKALTEKDGILLFGHSNPDGDALGSLLALGEALSLMGKSLNMAAENASLEQFGFLPGFDRLTADPGEGSDDYSLAVLLDCHALERAGRAAVKLFGRDQADGSRVMVLDHHRISNETPLAGLVDPAASSTGELVYHLLLELGMEISASMALNLFVAISTDTGSFSFDNTTPLALEIAADLVKRGADPWSAFRALYLNRSKARLELLGRALSGMEFFLEGRVGAITVTDRMIHETGALPIDTDGFVEYPRSVTGVEMAVFFKESGLESCKVSLRSLGRWNAAELAGYFGGGGHFQAAGFTLHGRLNEVKSVVLEKISETVAAEGEVA